jgi:hypothetical protein
MARSPADLAVARSLLDLAPLPCRHPRRLSPTAVSSQVLESESVVDVKLRRAGHQVYGVSDPAMVVHQQLEYFRAVPFPEPGWERA